MFKRMWRRDDGWERLLNLTMPLADEKWLRANGYSPEGVVWVPWYRLKLRWLDR